MDVDNLISDSSAFSISTLYLWKFSVNILLKPNLKDFEHYLVSLWNELNCVIIWTFFGIAFLEIEMKTSLFESCGHCWVFQICWHIEWNTLTESPSRIWNSSAKIPSPPLALFVLMLPKACLTSHSRMSGSKWVSHHHGTEPGFQLPESYSKFPLADKSYLESLLACPFTGIHSSEYVLIPSS